MALSSAESELYVALSSDEGRAPGFLPHAPWADVFREAARDKQYWDEHVRDAALKYIARGGVDRKKPTGSLENGIQKTPAPPGSGKRALKRQRQMESRRSTPAASSSAGGERTEGKGKRKDGKGKGELPSAPPTRFRWTSQHHDAGTKHLLRRREQRMSGAVSPCDGTQGFFSDA